LAEAILLTGFDQSRSQSPRVFGQRWLRFKFNKRFLDMRRVNVTTKQGWLLIRWRDPSRSKQQPTVTILGFQFGLYHVVVALSLYVVINLASLFFLFLLLADQILYISYVYQRPFRTPCWYIHVGIEDTGHATREHSLTNLLFLLFSSFFCPFILYCFTSTVSSTPIKSPFSFVIHWIICRENNRYDWIAGSHAADRRNWD